MLFNVLDNSILSNGNITIGSVYTDMTLSISETRATIDKGGDNWPTQTRKGCLPTRDFSLKMPSLMKKGQCTFLEEKKRNRSAD